MFLAKKISFCLYFNKYLAIHFVLTLIVFSVHRVCLQVIYYYLLSRALRQTVRNVAITFLGGRQPIVSAFLNSASQIIEKREMQKRHFSTNFEE